MDRNTKFYHKRAMPKSDSDQFLANILANTRTIAAVGVSTMVSEATI